MDSNGEAGEGYSDIQVEIEEESIGIVIEVKYVEGPDLEAGCREALEQIERKQYDMRLREDGMNTIFKYGLRGKGKENG